MAALKNITEARLKAALRKNAGIYSLAAKELGCDRTNITHRVERSAELQQFLADLEAEADDMASAIVIDTLGRRDLGGKPTKDAQNMARWLKDHGLRKRGIAMRLEHSGPNGAPLPAAPGVNVTITYSDAGPKDDVV